MRLLITGASGMLGADLSAAAAAAGHEVIALDRSDVDVTDAGAVLGVVRGHAPDVVVNCAAWTDVDGAESGEADATAVNARGAGHVAAAAAACGAFVVQVSTDYVFGGQTTEPYGEDAEPDPLSAYGRSKLAGEREVALAAPSAHAIVRSSWLFGLHGRNFVDTMLRLGSERDEVTVVDDQVGCPTYTGHLARGLLAVAEERIPGVVHLAGAGHGSWYDLATAAFQRAGIGTPVRRGRTADLGRPAPRPAFSVLACTRADVPRLPSWQQGLDDYLAARVAVAGGTR